MLKRSLISQIKFGAGEVRICGWVQSVRELSKSTFLVIGDATGTVQAVVSSIDYQKNPVHRGDSVEIKGLIAKDERSRSGYEVHIVSLRVLNLNSIARKLEINQIDTIGLEAIIENRPLSLRNERIGSIFHIQSNIVRFFREFLYKQSFREIVTSKIVSSGTEGGSNLFAMKYFEKTAYLAQSPQFYKEQCVIGLERVFETGHVYRAEPHATSRHLTEYFSLDVEMGFISGPEELIELEKQLLSEVFHRLNQESASELRLHQIESLSGIEKAPVWEFSECLERLKKSGKEGLVDDLDGEAEKILCALAEEECGVPAVFVIGFPLSARPFYTAPRGFKGAAQSFDLLYKGLEITTGGQRLHERAALESSLQTRGMNPKSFESHLQAFEMGMPPHGGFAIGLERLTAQILGLANVRQATLYPRDRNRIDP